MSAIDNASQCAAFGHHWRTAAMVYAWTRPGKGGPRTGPFSGQFSLREFAELGIRGLSKHDTVAKYREAMARAILEGLCTIPKIGESIARPSVVTKR